MALSEDEEFELLSLERQRTSTPKPKISETLGLGDAALALGTGTAGAVAGGLAGVAQGVKNLVSPGMPAGDRVRQVQDAMTYQPQTTTGKVITGAIAYPFEKLAEGADAVGGAVADASGSPALGAAVNTTIQALPGAVVPAARAARPAIQRMADRQHAAADLTRDQNALRDATLAEAQEAGYVIPPSAVNPSGVNKRLESIAGKAAVGQEAQIRNQAVTNKLVREELNLPANVPITETLLEWARGRASAPYREIERLPTPQPTIGGTQFHPVLQPGVPPAKTLLDLRKARKEAQNHYQHNSRSGDPAALEKAEAAWAEAERLEGVLEQVATDAGRVDLVPQLREARQYMAKTFDVQRALNLGDGNVDARVLGAMLDKGKPLSGKLETIAKFSEAFRPYTREGGLVPTPGVSKVEALAAMMLGGGGAAAVGPVGLLAGALPLASGPVRSAVLSPAYQSRAAQPRYGGTTIADLLASQSAERMAAGAAASAPGQVRLQQLLDEVQKRNVR